MDSFVKFTLGKLKSNKVLSRAECLALERSRTTKASNEDANLEPAELIGDKNLQRSLARYCFTKDELKFLYESSFGPHIVTRLVVNFLTTKSIAKMCQQIGLDKFVIASSSESHHWRRVLEDVFEAWIGACDLIFPIETIEKEILFPLFDDLDMDFEYEKIIDAKTRLNNIKDAGGFSVTYLQILGDESYSLTVEDKNGAYKHTEYTFGEPGNTCGETRKDAEMVLAQMMFDYFAQHHPTIYNLTFSTSHYQSWKKFATFANKNGL